MATHTSEGALTDISVKLDVFALVRAMVLWSTSPRPRQSAVMDLLEKSLWIPVLETTFSISGDGSLIP